MIKLLMQGFATICLGVLSLPGYAQETDVVEMSATVTGNQEQPKVIYIVPWQPAEDDSILYRPLNSKTDNVFGHVERSEHKRELKFIKEILSQEQGE